MSMEEKKINFYNRNKTDKIQLMTEGEIIIPDINPDIYRILKTDENAVVDSVKAEEGRICIEGRLAVDVLYYGKRSEGALSFAKQEFPFEDCIYDESIRENADADVITEIIHTDYRIINDRKIGVRSVTGIKALWTNMDEKTALSAEGENDDGILAKTGVLNTGTAVERKADELKISERLVIPPDRPDIGQIVDVTADVCHRDARMMAEGVQIKGDARVNLLYMSAEDFMPASAEFLLPFSGTMETETAEDLITVARIEPKRVSAVLTADENGEPRAADADITLGVVVKLFGRKTVPILEDAYSLSEKVEVESEEVEYMEVFGRNRAQGTFRTTVYTEGQPPVMQIVSLRGKIRSGSVNVGEGIINAEGVADMKLMYVAEDDNAPLYVIEESIPFSQSVEMKGVNENMDVDVHIETEDTGFGLLSENEVEIRITLGFDACVCEKKKCRIIKSIERSEEDSSAKGGAVIYTVKKGDTLWDIAKKYHSTPSDIEKLNGEDENELVKEGRRILIFKKFL